MGKQIGITVETRIGRYGEYPVVLYNKDAQRFILDNLDAVAATEAKKGKSYKTGVNDSEESND